MSASRRRSCGRLGPVALRGGVLGLLYLVWLSASADSSSTGPEVSIAPPASTSLEARPSSDESPTETLGLQTSPRELEAIGELARSGIEPHRENVQQLLHIADRGWPHGKVGTRFEAKSGAGGVYDKRCERLERPTDKALLPEAGRPLYALVLAHLLTGRESYAREAREVLLDFTRSSGFDTLEGAQSLSGANQCALEVSLLTPLLIDSALLLEAYPGWRESDERALGAWLRTEIYPLTAAIARKRKNNWGTAAAFASWAIGHYLSGTEERLEERSPAPRRLSPEEAKASHLEAQLRILGNDWQGDGRCTKSGVRADGGFPEELRRGSTGCEGEHLRDTDGSYAYQITTLSHLIYHAEALRRHGGNELYTYTLENGKAMLPEAIGFVTANESGRSFDWKATEIGVLRVANAFYEDARLCEQTAKGKRFAEGRYLPFARLTRPHGCE